MADEELADNEQVGDEKLEILKAAATKLSEHFDTVQIFATHHRPIEDDGTSSWSWGIGNYFARFGVIKQWLSREEKNI